MILKRVRKMYMRTLLDLVVEGNLCLWRAAELV